MCAINESARDGVELFLKPDPCNPWFYVNSAAAADSEPPRVTKIRRECIFGTRRIDRIDEVYDILRDSSNSIILGVTQTVQHGLKLLLENRCRLRLPCGMWMTREEMMVRSQ